MGLGVRMLRLLVRGRRGSMRGISIRIMRRLRCPVWERRFRFGGVGRRDGEIEWTFCCFGIGFEMVIVKSEGERRG